MKALVTGYTGLIGTHLVGALRARDWEVFNLEDSDGKIIDVRDAAAVESLTARVQPDVFFHLGGISGPMVAPDDPALVTEVNAVGTVNVFEAARKARVNRVVYAASLSGHDAGSEYNPVPGTVYGATKRFSEFIATIYAEQHGIETVSARIGAVYGKERKTVEVLDQMLIDARERAEVRYSRNGIFPVISDRDVGEALARLGEIENPPENCDLYTQTLSQKRLAHMVASAFDLPASSVVELEEGPGVLPVLTRIMYPHILLEDEVDLLPDALGRLV